MSIEWAIVVAHLSGLLVGGACGWLALRRDVGYVVVSRFWLENADRWEWLRQYELEQESKRKVDAS